MATAFQTLLGALDAKVDAVVDPAFKQLLAQVSDVHKSEQAELQALRDAYAGLEAAIAAIAPTDLSAVEAALAAVTARVEALEARNASDDAAAEEAVAPAPAPAPAPESEPAADPAPEPAIGDDTTTAAT